MSGCPDQIEVEDDGLYAPEVRDWSEQKYAHVAGYANIFSTSMKHKWDERVYIDLFAGAGHARLKETGKRVLSSAMLALSAPDPFTKYIFCDSDEKCLSALEARVRRAAPVAAISYILGNANAEVEQILREVPSYSSSHTVLSFCFVDPYKIGDLAFGTISSLGRLAMDFLVHLPAMDPIRNEQLYSGEHSNIDTFLGDQKWRSDWEIQRKKVRFDSFVAQQFGERMKALGYSASGIPESIFIRSTGKNLPLYRLGFFSKNKLAASFWNEIKKCNDPQFPLFS